MIRKRILALVLSALAVCSMLPLSSQAVGAIDTDAAVALTIYAETGGTVLSGARFDLYLVARVNASGELTVTEDFSRFAADIASVHEDSWTRLAQALEGWIALEQIQPWDSGSTNENGMLSFPAGDQGLTQGLYLVAGCIHRQDSMVYTPSSFMVMLPTLDEEGDRWNYKLMVLPKFEAKPEESEVVSRKALKVWDDKGYENKRPKEITVHLLKDGSVYNTVKLGEENNWTHTWEGLDPHAKWIITEDVPENYTVNIAREGITFVITNRYCGEIPPPPTNPGGGKLPQTGQLWWPVPVLMALGLALVVLGVAKRRGGAYEK